MAEAHGSGEVEFADMGGGGGAYYHGDPSGIYATHAHRYHHGHGVLAQAGGPAAQYPLYSTLQPAHQSGVAHQRQRHHYDAPEDDEGPLAPPGEQRGRCKWFNIREGFGFILPDAAGEEELFFHGYHLNTRRDKHKIWPGVELSYDTSFDNKGRPMAVNVGYAGSADAWQDARHKCRSSRVADRAAAMAADDATNGVRASSPAQAAGAPYSRGGASLAKSRSWNGVPASSAPVHPAQMIPMSPEHAQLVQMRAVQQQAAVAQQQAAVAQQVAQHQAVQQQAVQQQAAAVVQAQQQVQHAAAVVQAQQVQVAQQAVVQQHAVAAAAAAAQQQQMGMMAVAPTVAAAAAASPTSVQQQQLLMAQQQQQQQQQLAVAAAAQQHAMISPTAAAAGTAAAAQMYQEAAAYQLAAQQQHSMQLHAHLQQQQQWAASQAQAQAHAQAQAQAQQQLQLQLHEESGHQNHVASKHSAESEARRAQTPGATDAAPVQPASPSSLADGKEESAEQPELRREQGEKTEGDAPEQPDGEIGARPEHVRRGSATQVAASDVAVSKELGAAAAVSATKSAPTLTKGTAGVPADRASPSSNDVNTLDVSALRLSSSARELEVTVLPSSDEGSSTMHSPSSAASGDSAVHGHLSDMRRPFGASKADSEPLPPGRPPLGSFDPRGGPGPVTRGRKGAAAWPTGRGVRSYPTHPTTASPVDLRTKALARREMMQATRATGAGGGDFATRPHPHPASARTAPHRRAASFGSEEGHQVQQYGHGDVGGATNKAHLPDTHAYLRGGHHARRSSADQDASGFGALRTVSDSVYAAHQVQQKPAMNWFGSGSSPSLYSSSGGDPDLPLSAGRHEMGRPRTRFGLRSRSNSEESHTSAPDVFSTDGGTHAPVSRQ